MVVMLGYLVGNHNTVPFTVEKATNVCLAIRKAVTFIAVVTMNDMLLRMHLHLSTHD